MTAQEYAAFLSQISTEQVNRIKARTPDFVTPMFQLNERLCGNTSPISASLIKNARDALGDDAKKITAVPITFLPFYEANAYTIAPPDGGAIIAVDVALASSLYFLTFCMLRVLHGEKSKESAESIYQIARITSGATETFGKAGFKTDDVAKMLSSPLADEFEGVWESMVEFVLLHECYHVILDHLDPALTVRQKLKIDGEKEVDTFFLSRSLEFEADERALRTLVRRYGFINMFSEQLCLAVVLLFNYLSLIEIFRYNGHPAETSTHPSGTSRLQRALAILREGGTLKLSMHTIEITERFFEPLIRAASNHLPSLSLLTD